MASNMSVPTPEFGMSGMEVPVNISVFWHVGTYIPTSIDTVPGTSCPTAEDHRRTAEPECPQGVRE